MVVTTVDRDDLPDQGAGHISKVHNCIIFFFVQMRLPGNQTDSLLLFKCCQQMQDGSNAQNAKPSEPGILLRGIFDQHYNRIISSGMIIRLPGYDLLYLTIQSSVTCMMQILKVT